MTQQLFKLFISYTIEALSVAQRIVAIDTLYNSVRPLPSQQYSMTCR